MAEMLDEIAACEVVERDNLAVIYEVESLEPIEGKDRVELVHLKDCGFTTICEKGLHVPGDLVLFVKYDSIVPDIEMFSWMRESKFRIKPKSFTMRDEDDFVVGKIYSQGIVIKLHAVEEYFYTGDYVVVENDDHVKIVGNDLEYIFEEGTDLTIPLGVKKYIAPIKNGGTSFGNMVCKGDFPTHIVKKTDEVNLASKTRALEEVQGVDMYITQKIEGSSATVLWDYSRDELMVCSRNNQIGECEGNKFWQAVNKDNYKEIITQFDWLIIQAELAGPGIQKNKLGLTEPQLFVFNIFDRTTNFRFTDAQMVDFCKEHKLQVAYYLLRINAFDWDFNRLQAYADEQKYPNGEVAEGIVLRPVNQMYSQAFRGDWSVKVINREYKF